MAIIIIHLIMCLIISLIGHKRRITGTYSFLISATLSPIIGLIVTLISPSLKSERAYQKNSEYNKVLGIIFYCLSGLIIFTVIYNYFNKDNYRYDTTYSNWTALVIGIGFYILGEYLYRMEIPTKPISQETVQKDKVPLITKQSVKQLSYVLLVVIAILLVTNPSLNRFKEYKKVDTYEGLTRQQNWFLFSIYEDNHWERYLGICYYFFKLS